MSESPNVALATYDPRSGGGVRSVMEFVYETVAETGADPYLVYNALPWEDCTTLRNLLSGSRDIAVTEERHGEMDGVQIARGLPELLVTNYRLNRSAWQSALADADFGLVLGGPCLAGVPLARSEISYVVWMGTTIEDEREVQKRQFGLGRRIRYELARPVLKRQERTVLQNAEKVLVQSSYTMRQIVEKHGLDGDTVNVVPVPVDTETFSPGKPETDPKEMVFVGRLNDPRKNTKLLLEAFAQVLEAVPDAKLTLVGGKPDPQYTELMTELEIRENVSMPGKVPSVVPYLRRAAVFAFPSRQEGFGIAALEALACGTPVVSTRCGGPEDFVKDGKNGYLVSEGDVDGFGSAVQDLLQDHARRERFGEAAIQTARSNYTVDDVQDRLMEHLSEG